MESKFVNNRSERKHKNTIPFADKNIDQIGTILHGNVPLEVKNFQIKQARENSRESLKNESGSSRNIKISDLNKR